mmetsp:Transcript_37443/g.61543  ORF Transcript_37443/g.61543 Transcript_37443/m.61543 type:complete len:287 (-) Transcript_37443:97-957(-)
MLLLLLVVHITLWSFVCVNGDITKTPPSLQPEEQLPAEVAKIKQALHSAQQLFDTANTSELIERHNADASRYDIMCPEIKYFGMEAEHECSSFEDEITEYLRHMSGVDKPPTQHTDDWYWSQRIIWELLPTEFICMQTDHFTKLAQCLCAFCSWPFTIVDEKYPIHSNWKQMYDERKCSQKTKKSFMNTGDNICRWFNVPSGNKGIEIAQKNLKFIKLHQEANEARKAAQNNEAKQKLDDEHVQISESTMNDESASPIHFNRVPIVMTAVTIVVMICSAVFFAMTV